MVLSLNSNLMINKYKLLLKAGSHSSPSFRTEVEVHHLFRLGQRFQCLLKSFHFLSRPVISCLNGIIALLRVN